MADEATTFEVFRLEKPRPFDDAYQRNATSYKKDVDSIIRLLTVRADEKLKSLMNSINVRIINRGRAEAFTSGKTIFLDIAMLDLLDHSALESAISDIKSDPYHLMEFFTAYSLALSTDKVLEGIDPYNHAALDKEQWQTLWKDAQTYQSVYFHNCLAFILAHEIGHIFLEHDRKIKEAFPETPENGAEKTKWNKVRRQMELEADEFASNLSLNALYQPANVISWLTLIGIRRYHYGASEEYPTPGQREALILSIYQSWTDRGLMPAEEDPVKLEPLAPDRDVTRVGTAINLKRIREVREFRRNYLSIIDNKLSMLLKEGYRTRDATDAIVEITQYNRDLLGSTCEHKELLQEIINEIESNEKDGSIDKDKIRSLARRACENQSRVTYILNGLDEPDTDWQDVKSNAKLLMNQRPEFADAMHWKYFLANTVFRWHPDIYQQYLESVSRLAGEHIELKAYQRGKPLRIPPPSEKERVDTLLHWNGSYIVK